MLSRFADCEAVLGDPAFGRVEQDDARLAPGQARARAQRGMAPGMDGVNARSMLQMNPPDHTRLRRLVSRAFTPARVRELAPRVEALTASLLSGALDGPGGRFDLISELALPLPVAVISELLGIPVADRHGSLPGRTPSRGAWTRASSSRTRIAPGSARRGWSSPPTCAGCCHRGDGPLATT